MVTEPVDGSNAAVAVTTTGVPAQVVADASATPTVRIVNTYAAAAVVLTPPPGSLTINKELLGASNLRGDAAIRVQCEQVNSQGGSFDETQTVSAGVDPVPPLLFEPIPAPADCTVTETLTGENDAVDAIVIGETTVRVTPNSNVQVGLIDQYVAKTGSLRVRKLIDGPGAHLRGEVRLAVSCTDGTTATIVIPVARQVSEQTVAPIVAGSQCTVVETESGAVAGVVDAVVSPPGPQTVTIAANSESVVEVRDTYTAVSATLVVTKVIAGLAAGSQGDVVIRVSCSDGTSDTLTVPAGTPAGATALPALTVPFGTKCAAAETASGATASVDVATTFEPGVVVEVDGPTTIAVTNNYTFRPGRLIVQKVAGGDGAGLRGPVTIEVSCDGAVVGAATYPPGADLTSLVVSPIRAGASCTVTETADGAIPGVVDVATVISPAQPIIIPAGADVNAFVTSTYTSVLSSLTVTKETAGADEFRGTVVVTAECTPPVGPPVTVTQTYPPRSPLPPLVVGGLPAGTICVVSEPANGATPALNVTTTPALPLTVTIGPSERQSNTIVNTYIPVAGSLSIVKDIAGSAAGQQGPIEITATCGGSTTTFSISAGATSAGPFTVTGLSPGTTCVVDEPVNGATSTVQVTTTPTLPAVVTIPGGGSATATLTNRYEHAPASITVTKTITGPVAAQHGPVAIVVDCGPEHTSLIEIPAGAAPPPPLLLAGLPAPTTCNLSELLDGATDTVDVTTTGLGEVTLAPGDDTAVVVNDDYQLRPVELVLTKVIAGDGAAQHGPIQLAVNCSDGTTDTFDIPAGATAPVSFTVDGLEPGSTCTITEPVDGSTPDVAVATAPLLPFTTDPIPAGITASEVILDDYTRNTGRLVVVKQITGAAAASRGDITLTAECSDGTTASTTYTPTDPLTALDVGPLPFGTTCTVTEPNTGAANDVLVNGPNFNPGPVVTINQSLNVVTVGNDYQFAPGTVQLVKNIDGPAAAARGTVRLRLTCDDDVHEFDIPPGNPGPVTLFDAELPAGTTCQAIELNNGAASGVNVSTSYDPETRTVKAIAGETTTITVKNTYTPIPTGSLLDETILTGPAEPRRGTVQFVVSCDSGRTLTQTIATSQPADPALLGGLPVGTRCTITQPLDGDTPTIITTTSGLPTAPLNIGVGDTATVQVTDLYTDLPPSTTVPPATTSPPPPTTPPPTTTAPSTVEASTQASGVGGFLAATGVAAGTAVTIAIALSAIALGIGLRRATRHAR